MFQPDSLNSVVFVVIDCDTVVDGSMLEVILVEHFDDRVEDAHVEQRQEQEKTKPL